jgi:hypothetical protein
VATCQLTRCLRKYTFENDHSQIEVDLRIRLHTFPLASHVSIPHKMMHCGRHSHSLLRIQPINHHQSHLGEGWHLLLVLHLLTQLREHLKRLDEDLTRKTSATRTSGPHPNLRTESMRRWFCGDE